MLAIRTVRARWRTLLGSFLALAFGVGLLSATSVVIASATAQPPERLAGAAVLVASPSAGEDTSGRPQRRPWSDRDADRLAARLAELPGVRAAVPDHSFPAQLLVDGDLLGKADVEDPQGHGWSSVALSRYGLVSGTAPRADDEVVVPERTGLSVGDRVRLVTPTSVRPVTVVGVLDGPGIHLTDAAAARMSSGVGVVGVVLAPGADPVAAAEQAHRVVAGDGTVLTGTARARLETVADGRDRWVGAQLLGLMAVLSGFVSVFVVATTFGFAVTQRRREIGLLRVVGATPRQVRRMLYLEATVIGLLASAAGAAVGAPLAGVLGEWMVAAGMQPDSFRPRAYLWPVLFSVGVGLVVALLGVAAASRRASRVAPLEALRESASDRRPMTTSRWIFGTGSLAVGLGLGATAPGLRDGGIAAASAGAVAALITGLSLLAPVYLPWLVRLACLPLRRSSGALVELVREGTVAGVRRVTSTMAPVLLTVGFTVLVTGMADTMDAALGAGTRAALPASTVVHPAEGGFGVSDGALARLGTAAVAALPTAVYADGQRLPALGLRAAGDGGAVSGSTAGDRVAVSASAARKHGWRAGSQVDLRWADGQPARVRVAAVLPDRKAAAPVMLTWDTARRHDPAAVAGVAYVDGVDPGALDTRLAGTGARAVGRAAYQEAGEAEEERLMRLFILILLGMSVGFTALAIANAQVMATAERRREFAVLRLTGASVGQVLRTVVAESVLVVAVGGALGILVAWPGLLGIAAGLADDLDVAVSVRLPWPTVLCVVAACLVITTTAGLLTARSVTRTARPLG